MTGNVHEIRPSPSPPSAASDGGGNGRDLHGRVSALEAHLQHLATKEDIRRIETLIARRESFMLRWFIGTVIGVAVIVLTVAIAVVRMFVV